MTEDILRTGQILRGRFPPRAHELEEREWNTLKGRLPLGESVVGEVVAKAHFGAWIDIGVGFPALLEIPNIAGLTPEKYRSDDWCPIGSQVTATIIYFRDESRQVYLTQILPTQR